VSFNIRAEFTNIFNRVVLLDSLITATNARATQQRNPAGSTTAGFGRINTASVPGIPTQRQGMIVGRLTF
jgi:hypothetical protein